MAEKKKKSMFEAEPGLFGGIMKEEEVEQWDEALSEQPTDEPEAPLIPGPTSPEQAPAEPPKVEPEEDEEDDAPPSSKFNMTAPDLTKIENKVNTLVGDYEGSEAEFDNEARKIDEEFVNAINEAKAVYQTSSDKEASKQLWVNIIHGLGHILAGVVGNQTGLTIDGLKFQQPDWEARKANLLRELESAKGDAYKNMTGDQRRLSEQRAERARNYRMDMDSIQLARQGILDTWDRRFKLAQEQRRREQDALDNIKDLMKTGSGVDKQRLKEYNNSLQGYKEALNAFRKKDNEDNWKNLQAAIMGVRKNSKLAQQPDPLPQGLEETKGSTLWWTTEPEFEDIADKLINSMSSGESDNLPPGHVRLKSGRIVKVK